MSFQHDAVDDAVGRGPVADIHDQRLLLSETRLVSEYGLTDGLGVRFTLPVRVVDVQVRYLDARTRTPLALTMPNIHHRDETLSGLGDLWLEAHLSRALGRWVFDWRLGLSLPTGQTFDDPFLLGDQGLPHEHIQLGLGTVTPLVAFAARRDFARLSLGGWAFVQPVLYAGANGWRAGDRIATGLYAQSGFGLSRWLFLIGADLAGETAERWHGLVPPDEGNRGRLDVRVSAGAMVRVRDDVSLYAQLNVPVYVFVAGAQLVYPAAGTLGVLGSYDLVPHSHHHDDEGGPTVVRR